MTIPIYLNVFSYIFLHPQAFQRFSVSLVFFYINFPSSMIFS